MEIGVISRQRRWQLKKMKENLCSICGKEEIYKNERCFIHYYRSLLNARHRMRKLFGCNPKIEGGRGRPMWKIVNDITL